MKRFSNKTVLITGASAGIGAALAEQFAAEGASLVLLARRIERLEVLANTLRATGNTARVYGCDVTQPQALAAVVNDVVASGASIDVVVANAGFGVIGKIQQLTVEDYRRQFETNVFGVLNTIYATLPQLQRSRGQLVLMGSVAGYASLPGSSAYAMSKFAVCALAETVRADLANDGISVTLISPGFVESDIYRTDNQGRLHPNARDPLPKWLRVPASQAARAMVNAVHRKQRERIISVHGKLIVFCARYFPWLVRLLTGAGVKSRSEPRS
jgi:short-subunit dehydrogenase